MLIFIVNVIITDNFFSIAGVGVGMVIVSGIVCIYYNVIVAWTLYYLFMSFRAVLPWSQCGNEWNTEHCVSDVGGIHGKSSPSSSLFNVSSYNGSLVNGSMIQTGLYNISLNGTSLLNETLAKSLKKSASEEYWE